MLAVERILPATCAQVRNYLATHTSAEYQSVTRYAQALGTKSRSTRCQAASQFIRDELDSKSRLVKPMRRDQVLSADISVDDASVKANDESAEIVLVETGATFTTTKASSPPTGYQPSLAQSPTLPPRQTRPESTTDRSGSSDVRRGVSTDVTASCRLCLDPAPRVESCQLMGDDQERQKLLATRGMNFQKNRVTSARNRPNLRYGRLEAPNETPYREVQRRSRPRVPPLW